MRDRAAERLRGLGERFGTELERKKLSRRIKAASTLLATADGLPDDVKNGPDAMLGAYKALVKEYLKLRGREEGTLGDFNKARMSWLADLLVAQDSVLLDLTIEEMAKIWREVNDELVAEAISEH